MHFCLFRTLLFLLEVFPSSLWCSGVTGSWVNRPWGLGASPWEVWRGPSVLLLEGLPGNASPAARLLSVGSGVRGGGLPADADFNFTLRLWMYQLACGCTSSSQPRRHTLSWVQFLWFSHPSPAGVCRLLPCRCLPTPPIRGRGLFILSTLALAVLYCIWTLISLFPLRVEIRSVLLIILSLVLGTLVALSACVCNLEFNH